MTIASSILLPLLLTLSAVPADIPRPEHPRPQAQRVEWLNLNGTWAFAEGNEDRTQAYLDGASLPDEILVPFCRESELSGLHRLDLVRNVWYKRSFDKPDWDSPRVRLHIGACDWITTVYLNGKRVGEHVGGNVAFDFDITPLLKEKDNTLLIHAFDDTVSGLQALGKQSRTGKSHGIFYTPTTGIWQTVWLEGVGETFIEEYRVEPEPDKHRATINARLDGPVDGLTLQVKLLKDEETVATVNAPARWRDNRLVLPVPNPRLWSPEDPFLYDLELKLIRTPGREVEDDEELVGQAVDTLESYLGMRRVAIEGAAILLNGEPAFQRLVLDQGFYPDGIWTAPTDEALRRDIELSQQAGFNGARLHQKVFEPRFLYHADQLGYLVWGEFPSYGADYDNPAVNNPIIREWNQILVRDRNHPSIIGWCPFNETPADAGPLQHTIVELTRQLDPSRPVLETSGWTHTIPHPEVLDAHDYDQDPASFRERWLDDFAMHQQYQLPSRYGLPRVGAMPFYISEYGGIGWNVGADAWGYGNTPESVEAFYERFAGLTSALMDNPLMFGLCYTQLTDVEQEHNGIYTFGREHKFDLEPIRAALQRPAAFEQNPPLDVSATPVDWRVLVGAHPDGAQAQAWQYTTEAPADNWQTSGFDASAWQSAKAPFGQKEGLPVETEWTSSDIWLRQTFQYDNAETADLLMLVINHDDDAKVYLNGEPIWEREGWNNRYEAFNVTEKAAAALEQGENTLAVHVYQSHGGQYLDLALLAGQQPQ